jgi:anti-anti-sigma factor
VPRAAIRALLQTARRLTAAPGFRRWQTFRAMDASDAVLVITEWETVEELRQAVEDGEFEALRHLAAAWCYSVAGVEVLHPAFDRRLTRRKNVSTLLRISQTDSPLDAAAGRDSDLALRALAAPGSTRLVGARSECGATAVCRVDFDTEDGIWHFLESPLRRTWSAWATRGREAETWAINLPRLEYHGPAVRPEAPSQPARPEEQLSVQFTVSEDRLSAHIRLQGRVDKRGSDWCERLCGILLHDGCRRLEVDVSGLVHMSPEALHVLTHTARDLKERGGQFVLVDNEERVLRVTRSKHLQTSLR